MGSSFRKVCHGLSSNVSIFRVAASFKFEGVAMKQNVGNIDKAIRIVMAIAIFSLYFVIDGNLKFVALIGLIPLLTALVSVCPLYTIFGLSTCSLNKHN